MEFSLTADIGDIDTDSLFRRLYEVRTLIPGGYEPYFRERARYLSTLGSAKVEGNPLGYEEARVLFAGEGDPVRPEGARADEPVGRVRPDGAAGGGPDGADRPGAVARDELADPRGLAGGDVRAPRAVPHGTQPDRGRRDARDPLPAATAGLGLGPDGPAGRPNPAMDGRGKLSPADHRGAGARRPGRDPSIRGGERSDRPSPGRHDPAPGGMVGRGHVGAECGDLAQPRRLLPGTPRYARSGLPNGYRRDAIRRIPHRRAEHGRHHARRVRRGLQGASERLAGRVRHPSERAADVGT